jgi:hypothetical protein
VKVASKTISLAGSSTNQSKNRQRNCLLFHEFYVVSPSSWISSLREHCLLEKISVSCRYPDWCAYIRAIDVRHNHYFGLRYALYHGLKTKPWQIPGAKLQSSLFWKGARPILKTKMNVKQSACKSTKQSKKEEPRVKERCLEKFKHSKTLYIMAFQATPSEGLEILFTLFCKLQTHA